MTRQPRRIVRHSPRPPAFPGDHKDGLDATQAIARVPAAPWNGITWPMPRPWYSAPPAGFTGASEPGLPPGGGRFAPLPESGATMTLNPPDPHNPPTPEALEAARYLYFKVKILETPDANGRTKGHLIDASDRKFRAGGRADGRSVAGQIIREARMLLRRNRAGAR